MCVQNVFIPAFCKCPGNLFAILNNDADAPFSQSVVNEKRWKAEKISKTKTRKQRRDKAFREPFRLLSHEPYVRFYLITQKSKAGNNAWNLNTWWFNEGGSASDVENNKI